MINLEDTGVPLSVINEYLDLVPTLTDKQAETLLQYAQDDDLEGMLYFLGYLNKYPELIVEANHDRSDSDDN